MTILTTVPNDNNDYLLPRIVAPNKVMSRRQLLVGSRCTECQANLILISHDSLIRHALRPSLLEKLMKVPYVSEDAGQRVPQQFVRLIVHCYANAQFSAAAHVTLTHCVLQFGNWKLFRRHNDGRVVAGLKFIKLAVRRILALHDFRRVLQLECVSSNSPHSRLVIAGDKMRRLNFVGGSCDVGARDNLQCLHFNS